jgi:hypothetical protein
MVPLVDDIFRIEKFSCKGGWTYVLLPQLKVNKKEPFGWRNVYGNIDNLVIENYNLQPFGNGQLFLPLNAKIRKFLKKNVGENVKIKLYETMLSNEDITEIINCFQADEQAYIRWQKLTNTNKNKTLNHIFRAKNEDEKAKRILAFIDNI